MEQESHIQTNFSIEALQSGNEQAFEAVFHQYYKALCYFSDRIVKNSQVAEDIAEETFIKLWERHDEFQNLQHIRSFLYKTAYRSCLDFLKTDYHSSQREATFSESFPEEENFYLELIRTETLHTLYRAIRELPEQCGKIISMSYVEGKKNEEIANELRISIQTVKNQKSKGIKQLRKQFPDAATGLIIFLALQELLH